MHDDLAPRRRLSRAVAALAVAAAAVFSSVLIASPAQAAPAAACSQATSQSSCTINTSTTVTAGALGLIAPSNLYWGFVQSGYDQIQSGSSSSFSGACTAATGGTTSCPGAAAPLFGVVDARGGTAGWALTAWIDTTGTGATSLPSGSTLSFNGANAGAAPGTSVAGSATTATTPTNTCDKNSTCTTATAATSCATGGSRPFTACPVYGTNLTAANSSTNQLDLYSANTSTGLGAVCFGSGTVIAAGCTGLTPTGYFNMMMKGGAQIGTYTPIINLTVSSGP